MFEELDRTSLFDFPLVSLDGKVDPPTEECPGCGQKLPVNYLTTEGLCDHCIDDIEGITRDD